MLKTEEFKKKNQELQQIISEEICKAENGATDRNIYQLRTILKELLNSTRGPYSACDLIVSCEVFYEKRVVKR